MPTVYVAGPVLKESADDKRNHFYREIYETLTRVGFRVILPVQDPELEHARPRAFYRLISDRIESADVVIALFPDRNRSVPIESTIAAHMHKDQYLIGDEVENIPRLLQGLPGIQKVVPIQALAETLQEIQEQLKGPPGVRWKHGGEESGGGMVAT